MEYYKKIILFGITTFVVAVFIVFGVQLKDLRKQIPSLSATPASEYWQGGTGTSTRPTDGDLLFGDPYGQYGQTELVAGSGITISTTSLDTNLRGTLTISSSAAGSVFAWTPDDDVTSPNGDPAVATSTLTIHEGGLISHASSTFGGVVTVDGALYGSSTASITNMLHVHADANNRVLRLEENSGGEYFNIEVDATGDINFIGSDDEYKLTIPLSSLAGGGIAASTFYGMPTGGTVDSDTYLSFTDDAYSLVAGNVNFFSFTEAGTDVVVFNEDQVDIDFRLESDVFTHALFLEGSSGNIGIGTTSPYEPLSVTGGVVAGYFRATSSPSIFEAHFSASSTASFGDNLFIDTGGNLIVTDLTDKKLLAADATGTVISTSTIYQSKTISFNVASSSMSTTTDVAQHKFSMPVVITRVSCSSDTGTSTIQFDERTEATPNTAGTDIHGEGGIICGSEFTSASTTFTNAEIAADVPFNFEILDAEPSGEVPKLLRVHVEYVESLTLE